MAAAALTHVPDPEAGKEVQFCPIQGLPIHRGQRVRTLPGFHLISLGAGRQALALGHYEAFGKSFPCHDLEYLHADDKVFICAEDHKAFLNQMSMQYHKYIRHELEERKAERKRLRERAKERSARSVAHAKQLEQRAAQVKQKRPAEPATARQPPSSPSKASPKVSAADDPYLGAVAAPAAATIDPYLGAVATPTLAAVASPAGATEPQPAELPPPLLLAPEPAAAACPAASAVPAAPAPVRPQPVEEDDLYGDVAGSAAKKQRSTSTYASAIGSMLANDFDEED